MLPEAYLQHLQTYFLSAYDNRQFWKALETYANGSYIVTHSNLDPARELLKSLHSPVKRCPFRDPTAMLRSLILITLLKISSTTYWVRQTHSIPLFPVLAGYDPDKPQGIGTYNDLFKRIIDGSYYCHLRIRVFCGDGHHDSLAHYRYFQEKEVIPVIPLSENSRTVLPKATSAPWSTSNLISTSGSTPLFPATVNVSGSSLKSAVPLSAAITSMTPTTWIDHPEMQAMDPFVCLWPTSLNMSWCATWKP